MAEYLIHENIWLTRQIYEEAEISYYEQTSSETIHSDEITLKIERAETGISEMVKEKPILEIKHESQKDKNDEQKIEDISLESGDHLKKSDVFEDSFERRIMESLSFEDLFLLSNCYTPSESDDSDYYESEGDRLLIEVEELKYRIDGICERAKIVEQKVEAIRSLIARSKPRKKVRMQRITRMKKDPLPEEENVVLITPPPTVGMVTLDVIPVYEESKEIPNYEETVRKMFIIGVVWAHFEWITIKEDYRKFRIRCYILENKINLEELMEKLKDLPDIDSIYVMDYYPIYPD